MADTLGLVMLDNDDDPQSVTDETFDRALASVQAAVDSEQIRRFTGNDYVQPLANGDLGGVHRVVGRHRRGRWPTTRTSSGRSPRRAGSSGPTT